METFKKREKEMRRLERQRNKAARRMQRKQDRATAASDTPPDDEPSVTPEGSAEAPPTTDE